jgi:hypothetical protein
VETTGPGFGVGEIPKEFAATRDKVFELNSPLARIHLMSDQPGSPRTRQSDYYVQEDGATSKVCPQNGDCMLMTRSMRNVMVNGETFTSTSVMRWLK